MVNKPKPEILLFDGWYSKEEEALVWKELDLFSQQDKFERAENTVVAKNRDGTPKGKSFRLYLSLFYNNNYAHMSPIQNFSSKVLDPKFQQIVRDESPMFSRTFFNTNKTHTLISYYDDSDYYDSHIDSFFWTMLIWFYKEPKKFTGGDLYFEDFDITIPIKHNRAIMFPCYYMHASTLVNLPQEEKFKNLGKYTITHFFDYINP